MTPRHLCSRLAFVLGAWLALLIVDELCGHLLSKAGYEVDPDFGEVREFSRVVYRLEGNGISNWLARGVRDPGRPAVPGPRVLVLGDSQTHALQVNDSQTFCAVAEGLLRQRGFGVNLLNCGHSTRSVADYVKLAPAFQREMKPDWVVFLLQEIDLGSDAWDEGKTHLEFSAQGHLVVSQLPADPVPRPRQPRSRTFSWGSWVHEKLRLEAIFRVASFRLASFNRRWSAEPPVFRGGVGRPQLPAREYPIDQAGELLLDSYGTRTTVLWLRHFNGRSQAGRPTPGQLQFQELCRQRQIHFVDLGLEFAHLVELGRAPRGFPNTYWNAGHLNAVGHDWIGRVLDRELWELHQRGIL